jgi:hypothetical protein
MTSHRLPVVDSTVISFPANVLNETTAERLVLQVNKSGQLVLHLDVAGVEYATAGGLVRLVALDDWLRAAGGELVLVEAEKRVFCLSSLGRVAEMLTTRHLA